MIPPSPILIAIPPCTIDDTIFADDKQIQVVRSARKSSNGIALIDGKTIGEVGIFDAEPAMIPTPVIDVAIPPGSRDRTVVAHNKEIQMILHSCDCAHGRL